MLLNKKRSAVSANLTTIYLGLQVTTQGHDRRRGDGDDEHYISCRSSFLSLMNCNISYNIKKVQREVD